MSPSVTQVRPPEEPNLQANDECGHTLEAEEGRGQAAWPGGLWTRQRQERREKGLDVG